MNMKQRDLLPSMSFPDEGSTYAILRRSIRLKWHRLRCLSPLHSGPTPLLPSTLCTGQYPSLRSLLGYFFALPMLPCRNITATHHPNRRIWPQLREESARASPCKWCLERLCCKGWGEKHVVEKKKVVFSSWLKTTCRVDRTQIIQTWKL